MMIIYFAFTRNCDQKAFEFSVCVALDYKDDRSTVATTIGQSCVVKLLEGYQKISFEKMNGYL